MEKNVEISLLCQFYGKLLTKKQLAILQDYYDNDLSLGEIAENLNISRQGVRDIIKKGEKRLFDFEEKLKFMKTTLAQQKKVEAVLLQLTQIKEQSSDKKINRILESVRKELNCLK